MLSAILHFHALIKTVQANDDTAPPNGFNDILNEVREEVGYESDESDEAAW
jgi:hypothetical protein